MTLWLRGAVLALPTASSGERRTHSSEWEELSYQWGALERRTHSSEWEGTQTPRRRHLYCGTPVVTSWAVAGQQVVFLHMYLQTRVTLRAFPIATPRGRSSSSHGGESHIHKAKAARSHSFSIKNGNFWSAVDYQQCGNVSFCFTLLVKAFLWDVDSCKYNHFSYAMMHYVLLQFILKCCVIQNLF